MGRLIKSDGDTIITEPHSTSSGLNNVAEGEADLSTFVSWDGLLSSQGTFSPTYVFSTSTDITPATDLSIDLGYYFKFGRFVWVTGAVAFSSFKPGNVGIFRIGNLPFPVDNNLSTTAIESNMASAYWYSFSSLPDVPIPFAIDIDYIEFRMRGASGTPIQLSNTYFSDTSSLRYTVAYITTEG